MAIRILEMASEKTKNNFKVNRKKHFLTWSCPVEAEDNPIPDCEKILAFAQAIGELSAYSIGEELHENGKRHYHAALDYVDTVQSANCRLFDICGVHPNWIKCEKRHWRYTQKFGKFIATEVIDIWGEASRKRTAAEAIDFLWREKPQDMVKFGHNIERNLRRRIDTVSGTDRRYRGPYIQAPGADWDPDQQTLVVVGPPGIGKTQWAKYFAEHSGRKWIYIKNSIEGLKHKWVPGVELIIFDDISIEKYQDKGKKDWSDIFDINEGGSIHMRNVDFEMPAGVHKMWLCNQDRWDTLLDGGGRVKNGRRSYVMTFN